MRNDLLVAFVVAAAALAAIGVLGCRRARDPEIPPPSEPAGIVFPPAANAWQASGPPVEYDSHSIYSYIDGHAEVYLAYGMKRCVTRRYAGPSGAGDLVADVFELSSPEDAYGVFTYDQDGEDAGILNDSLFRFGWLSFWKSSYFVSIVVEAESDASREAALILGRSIAAAMPSGGARPAIVGGLPADGLLPRSVRFLRHPQILNTHVFLSDENVLGLGPDTPAALGSYGSLGAPVRLLLVDYPDAARASAAALAFASSVSRGAPVGDPVEVGGRGFFAARAAGKRLAAVLGAPTGALARARLQAGLEGRGGTP